MAKIIAPVFVMVMLVLPLSEQKSQASDYGCQVLLCLSNPRGATAEPACVPPISRLHDDLRHRRGFPTCDMGGNGSGSYAVHGSSWYDACPQGTTALPEGVNAVVSGKENQLLTGIGEGTDPGSGKVCVAGNPIGAIELPSDNGDRIVANVYKTVTVLSPAKSPNYIDIYVAGKLSQRVRW